MEKLIIVKTLDQLQELREYLKDKEYIAFDTETSGVTKDSSIIGFSLCADVEISYYVILSYWDKEQQKLIDLETKQQVSELLKDLINKQLIMHNAFFDCWMVENNFKVTLLPHVHTDTMILGHLLDENRRNGLKELSLSLFGQDSVLEQSEMKESVTKNGGVLTKVKYELYKADSDLIARYGAKDAILTLKLFYTFVPELFEQDLDKFFYEDESMPLVRGTTYDLNSVGLKVDPEKLATLRSTLEAECLEIKAFIYNEIADHITEKYPGTNKSNTFNINSSKQLAWLLFVKLGNPFHTLTDEGRELCNKLNIKIPYNFKAKREFIQMCTNKLGSPWTEPCKSIKTGKEVKSKVIREAYNYLSCNKESLKMLADKYIWVAKLLEYSKKQKLLNTYIDGIQEKMQYNVIHPSFLQHGTTSGRYSCKEPNFQNLPRDDKRIKACIVSRPGKVFVGADYSQLEPRVFASFSQDPQLIQGFKNGDDFYSIIGREVFDKPECSLNKDEPESFAKKYPKERNITKTIALAATYGANAGRISSIAGVSMDEAQDIIDSYFERFPSVERMMLESHESAKKNGQVVNLFGRPRRMPKALDIEEIYGNAKHSKLPYEAKNLLNLSVNHRIQSTGASIVNRASIAFLNKVKQNNLKDCHIVLQVHDEIVVECWEENANKVANLLKDAMENTVVLPSVDLIAEPRIANNLADLK